MSSPVKNLRSSARSTVIVMISTTLSRLLGFVRIGIISAIFGGGQPADIINYAFSIPNNLRKLLAEGALSTAFIPVISKNIVKDPSLRESNSIVRSLLGFQLIVLLPLLAFSTLFPHTVINLLLNISNPDTQYQVGLLFRYMVYYILFISISAVLMGTLNSNERFIIPGLTPLMFSVSVISSLLLFHRSLGVYSMAVGVLVGGVAQLLFQLPQFIRTGYRFGFSFNFSSPGFREILRNWGPVLITSGVFAINQFIAMRFASEMSTGSWTAMQNAIVFWQFPYGIFSASIVTVLYPRLSKQIGAGQRDETSRTVEFGVSSLMTFLIPSSLGLMLLGPELISTALQRGEYTAADSMLAARVLFWYAPGLVFVGVNQFLQRLCFSDGDIRLPVYNAVIITVVDIALSLWLKETFLRVSGLALANSLSYIIASTWLMIKSRKHFPQIRFRPIVIDLLKIMLSLIPGALIILGGKVLFGNYWMDGSSLINLLKFLAVALPAIGSILGMLLLLRLEGIYLVLKRS